MLFTVSFIFSWFVLFPFQSESALKQKMEVEEGETDTR